MAYAPLLRQFSFLLGLMLHSEIALNFAKNFLLPRAQGVVTFDYLLLHAGYN